MGGEPISRTNADFTISNTYNIKTEDYEGRGTVRKNIGKLNKTIFTFEDKDIEGTSSWDFEGGDLDYTIINKENG